MALLKAARQLAAEFDYPAKELNRGVEEFIKQMGQLLHLPT